VLQTTDKPFLNAAAVVTRNRLKSIGFKVNQYARTDRHRFLSHSMAKTITAMLIGIAISEGAIKSIDDPAATYVPQLVGTECGQTAIRDLLHMASGVAFGENYDGKDDYSRLVADLSRKPTADNVRRTTCREVALPRLTHRSQPNGQDRTAPPHDVHHRVLAQAVARGRRPYRCDAARRSILERKRAYAAVSAL
jgi:CubicO group peptidase (beta-lactamase class C family)